MRGFTGLQGPIGVVATIKVTDPKTTITPFIPIGAAIRPEAIYLNAPSSFYTINVSVEILGDAYVPQPIGPGQWRVKSIFVGKPPAEGVVPDTYYNMNHEPVTFFFQNVGGLPIELVFDTNDTPDSVVYLSFGTSPNQTPSSYLLHPLSILIIQAVFTSNNAIRFYNSFLDAINYEQLYRILDRSIKRNYFPPPTFNVDETVNELAVYEDIVFELSTTAKSLAQTSASLENSVTVTIDGTGLPKGSVNLFIFRVKKTSNLVLKGLVGTRNYKGEGVPTVMNSGIDLFVVVDDVRVVAYDNALSTLKYPATTVHATNKELEGELSSTLEGVEKLRSSP